MFYDLSICLKFAREHDRAHAAIRAIELGYSCIVWSSSALGKSNHINQMKPHKPVEIDAAAFEAALVNRSMTSASRAMAKPSELQQLSRITVGVEDLAEAQALASSSLALLRYDIVAACPRSLPALIHLCKTADIDIISLDLNHQMHFTVDPKLIAAATKRGVVFEICYSHLMHASSSRRLNFENCQLLLNFGRSGCFILTSDAEATSHLRAPHDVINAGIVLGMSETQARMAVTANCAGVLRHAAARRLRYQGLEVIPRSDLRKRYPQIDLLDGQGPATASTSTAAAAVNQEGEEEEEEYGDGGDSSGMEEDDEEDDDDDDSVLKALRSSETTTPPAVKGAPSSSTSGRSTSATAKASGKRAVPQVVDEDGSSSGSSYDVDGEEDEEEEEISTPIVTAATTTATPFVVSKASKQPKLGDDDSGNMTFSAARVSDEEEEEEEEEGSDGEEEEKDEEENTASAAVMKKGGSSSNSTISAAAATPGKRDTDFDLEGNISFDSVFASNSKSSSKGTSSSISSSGASGGIKKQKQLSKSEPALFTSKSNSSSSKNGNNQQLSNDSKKSKFSHLSNLNQSSKSNQSMPAKKFKFT